MTVDSAIFEVIIGMVFVFSLLSILVTQINNVLAAITKLRARHLRRSIDRMIDDPALRAKVLTHPLIRMLQGEVLLPDQKLSDEQAKEILTKSKLNNLGWIDPNTFVSVLINLIRVTSDKEIFAALLNIVDGMPATGERRKLRLVINQIMESGLGLDELRTTIAELSEPIYREALTEAMDQIDDEIGKLGLEPNTIVSLMAGLRNVKNPYLRTALETVLRTSKTLDEAETKLMQWFEEGMYRASDTFRQNMSVISFVVGACIALFMNVDSINLARTLWEDPALRGLVARTAQRADVTALQSQYEQTQASIESDPTTDPGESIEAVQTAGAEALRTVDTLLQLRLPLGWRYNDLSALDPADQTNALLFNDVNNLWNMLPGNNPAWFSLLLGKIVGLFLTVIAIMQGAPFWFNIIKRLTGGKE